MSHNLLFDYFSTVVFLQVEFILISHRPYFHTAHPSLGSSLGAAVRIQNQRIRLFYVFFKWIRSGTKNSLKATCDIATSKRNFFKPNFFFYVSFLRRTPEKLAGYSVHASYELSVPAVLKVWSAIRMMRGSTAKRQTRLS